MTEDNSNKKTVSVIIVSYQTGPALWVCLYRVLQLKGLHEVIVVNNGNEGVVEAHLRKLEQKHRPIRYITGHGNVGFAKGCNIGAKAATGDVLVLLNPDAVLMEDDALLRLSGLFDHKDWVPPVGMVGGVLRNDDGSEQRASRRNFITPKNAILDGLGLHKLRGIPYDRINLEDTPLPDRPAAIPAISGACMVMERERYAMLHGLDENYFLHVEDMDLCKRVYNAGGGVWIHPGVNVLHYRSTSNVGSVFIERKKTAGFFRYFHLHYARNVVWRLLADIAVTLRLAGKIMVSFADDNRPMPMITDAEGLCRVQAIVRGVEGMLEALKNRQALPVAPGSTVLVTGASSAVGLFAIGRLLTYGCKVIALKHSTLVGFFHPNLKWVEGDLTTPEKLAASLAGIKCDYALHCAPVWHTQGLAAALKPAGVKRIVAVGSTSLMTKASSPSKDERNASKRLADGEAVLAAECAAQGIEWTVIRPTMVYGAGFDKNVSRIARMIDRKRKFVLPKEASGLRAPIHADDLALAGIMALGKPAAANKAYNLQGGTVMPYHEMVERIFEAMDVKPKIRRIANLHQLCGLLHPFFPSKVPHPAIALRMQDDLVFDDAATRAELGIKPRPFLQDGIYDLGVCGEATCRSLLPA